MNSGALRLRRVIVLGWLCGVLLTASGCAALFGNDGLFPDRSNEYLKSRERPPLKIPEPENTASLNDAYPIPELAFAKVLPKRYEVPRVEPLDQVEGKGSVRIQRFAGDQWILVRRSPSQAWPLVLSFLQSNQVPLRRVDAEAGVIETDLLVADASNASLDSFLRAESSSTRASANGASRRTKRTDEPVNKLLKERYRFILKAGVQRNSAEIWVEHKALQDESAGTARRENMVALLAEHLAGSPEQSSHSLLAQGLGSAAKVKLQYETNGEPFLQLQLPFDRGWASLGLALKKASFVVHDLDRSNGVYLAEYVERKKKRNKPGFFARLFGRKPTDGEAADNVASLAVKVLQQDDGITIKLQRREQPWLQANEQAFLLRKILHKLS
ncbi:MAG: outer membrane protein assembly factor BamC [Pseudomonadales bacterium]|nr:outer membrane protein assembly factor BamC [Pseudomonadales bacterium]